MKKNLFAFVVVVSTVFYMLHRDGVQYFQKTDKKLDLLSEERFSSSFENYDKPIQTINLIEKTQIPLFCESSSYFPKIYGYKDRFLLKLQSSVAVLDEQKVLDSLVAPSAPLSLIDVVADKKKAYILIDGKLYVYDGKSFKPAAHRFDFSYLHLFIDEKKLYFDKEDTLLVLDRDLRNYTNYKKNKKNLDGAFFRYGRDGWFYFKKGRNIEAVSLHNELRSIVKNVDAFRWFKNYYIIKKEGRYTLYTFPKKRIVSFYLKKRDIDNFFLLKNTLFLINDDTIFAKVDLDMKQLHFIKPFPFCDLYGYDVNDNFVAHATKNYTVEILDSDLHLVKEYKINALPSVFSYAVEKNSVAYIDFKKKRVFLNGKELCTLKNIDTSLAFDGSHLAVVGYDNYTKNLFIDLYDGYTHKKSYTLKQDARFILKTLLYKDTLVISFSSKALIIKNGKVLKEIKYAHKFGNEVFLKKIGNKAYLGYNDTLKEIDLDTLKIKNVASRGYGIQKGKNVMAYVDKLLHMSLLVDFGDKEFSIAPIDELSTYFTLKDYVVVKFLDEDNTVYVIAKDKITKLLLTTKHNAILNLFGLDNNRFGVVDGFGLRVVDLDESLK